MKKGFRHAPDRMISGKRRPKAKRRGEQHQAVTVGGTEYLWAYRHGWLVWGKGIRAISISVSLDPGRMRELILDFTLPVEERHDRPPEERVLQALIAGIQAALEAGWEPESRGRAFRYEVIAPAP